MKFESSDRHREDELILYSQKKNLKIQRGADADEDSAHHHHLGVMHAGREFSNLHEMQNKEFKKPL
jgi:hypothetical protein